MSTMVALREGKKALDRARMELLMRLDRAFREIRLEICSLDDANKKSF